MVPDQQGLILAGDVGGTNARFAAFAPSRGFHAPVWEQTVPSRSVASFLDVLRAVRSSVPGSVAAATFGVAGPVRHGVCRATNLPWIVDARRIAEELRLPSVGLMNDLEANAWGIEVLVDADLATLQPADPDPDGATALVSAGTGLGEAGTIVIDGVRRPFACEGGHSSFSPNNEREIRLWRRLAAVHGHVSWERVLSGPGLVAVYEFVRDDEGSTDSESIASARRTDDYGKAIVKAAAEGTSAVADRAIEFFASLYGSEVGNTALEFLATGGVYLGGGLAPKLLSWLRRPAFLEAFRAKGRMRPILETVPVRVILEPRAALFGAARHAAAAGAR
jgi:glucokinase